MYLSVSSFLYNNKSEEVSLLKLRTGEDQHKEYQSIKQIYTNTKQLLAPVLNSTPKKKQTTKVCSFYVEPQQKAHSAARF